MRTGFACRAALRTAYCNAVPRALWRPRRVRAESVKRWCSDGAEIGAESFDTDMDTEAINGEEEDMDEDDGDDVAERDDDDDSPDTISVPELDQDFEVGKDTKAPAAHEGMPYDGEEWPAEPRPRRAPRSPECLTKNQQQAVAYAIAGKNVFIGGGIGTGKTETLLQIYEKLRGEQPANSGPRPLNIRRGVGGMVDSNGVALLTASAAMHDINLGPYTGSAAACVPMTHTVEAMDDMLVRSRMAFQEEWDNCRVLIIDDVHLWDHDLWTAFQVCLTKRARNRVSTGNVGLFGDIQVIVAGDFLAAEQGALEEGLGPNHGNHAFEDPNWDAVFGECQLELEGTDGLGASFAHEPSWAKLLARFRMGEPTPEDFRVLQSREVDLATDPQLSVVKSYRAVRSECKKSPRVLPDPLAGRLLVQPLVKCSNVARSDPSYLMNCQKKFVIPPKTMKQGAGRMWRSYSPWMSYPPHRTHPDHEQFNAIRKNTRRKMFRFAVGNLRQTVANLSPSFPVRFYIQLTAAGRPKLGGYEMQMHVAVGDEVVCTVDAYSLGVLQGDRGVVHMVKPESVIVDFGLDCGPVEVFPHRIDVTADPASMELTLAEEEDFKAEVEGRVSTTFSVWVLPISNDKSLISELQHCVPRDGPRVLVDTVLVATGPRQYRSLYACLSHAYSADRLDLVGMIKTQNPIHQLTYPRARAYHSKMLRGVVEQDLCPVCNRSNQDGCNLLRAAGTAFEEKPDVAPPAAPPMAVPSPGESPLVRWCCTTWRYCSRSKKGVLRHNWMLHSMQMQKVRCECGAILRRHEVEAHRARYAKPTGPLGPRCYGVDQALDTK
eukprot:TRINITY_DN42976_c0_g1_i1.p1 TRINITY_DN42976_c0_g1~~TRINITY_DN42976_c0_g1_i1.p1  ORF type:complete len:846 (+),score=174.75 TRINITY_DN42976_c0_g1_i1:54-2540(+)